MIDFAAANAALGRADGILIVTHSDPDGDAIGSLLGLGNALRAQGIKVACAVDGGVPAFLQFLPHADQVLSTLPGMQADLLICLDANQPERVGQVGAQGMASCSTVINLDHHVSNTGFGDIQLVVPEAAAACEVVFHWLRSLSLPLTVEVAQPLLTGLVTDTLGFRTSNVRAATLQIALELMGPGISLYDIVAQTFEKRPIADLLLWQEVLPSLTLEEGVAAAQIRVEDCWRAGLEPGEDGDLPSLLRSTAESRVAVVFREMKDGSVSLSMRSKPPCDVAQVAVALGGGGHAQAAGATIAGPLQAARERVLPLLHAAANGGSATTRS
ncbi:MAG: DHH family phosphoesterase [Anaerolineae bacterium]|nr:DHH family phosphoesterase [Anaerolineae bacterium]